MRKRNGTLIRLIVACAICAIAIVSCLQLQQVSNKPTTETPIATIAFYSTVSELGFIVDSTAGAITSGRARALVAAIFSLISLAIGGIALFRSSGRNPTGNGRVVAIVALVLGLIGVVLAVVHLGSSTGGFGTGGGRAGAIVALVLGLVGMNLGGLALVRSRRSRYSVGDSSK